MLSVAVQTRLVIEGTSTVNTSSGDWEGLNITRNSKTHFIFRNNSVISSNFSGYMLHAGDEQAGPENNNLDGQIITGNKFQWIGKKNAK